MKKFLAIVLLLLVGVVCFLLFANYSTGSRTGVIMKLSKKGILFKTNEGQLNVGGFDQTVDDGVSNVWSFSIRNQDVLDDMNDAMDHSMRVKLYYKEKYIKLPWWGDTKYFIYDVEELGPI